MKTRSTLLINKEKTMMLNGFCLSNWQNFKWRLIFTSHGVGLEIITSIKKATWTNGSKALKWVHFYSEIILTKMH